MKKLYEKNGILFAIGWIVLYTVGIGSLRSLGDDSPYMLLGLIAISALLLLFVTKNGLTEECGLSGWAKNSRAMLWFLPLWGMACCNLIAGIRPEYTMPGLLYACLSMALVGFAEEVIFRGFLFRAMLRDGGVKTAVIVSALTFGIGHIVNLLTGHDLGETLVQVVYAVTVGFAYTLAYYKSGSLLPCILAHSLTDVFYVLGPSDVAPALYWAAHAVVFVLAACYCVYLLRRVETPAVNRVYEEKSKA